MLESLFWIAVLIAPITLISWLKHGVNFALGIAILFGAPLAVYAATKQDLAVFLVFVIILWFLIKNER